MSSPRLLILANGGDLADDLETWLRGPFQVERCADLNQARRALSERAAALIVVPGAGIGAGPEFAALLRRAAAGRCRTLLLDGAVPAPAPVPGGLLLHLPLWPSPGDLARGLAGLSAAVGA